MTTLLQAHPVAILLLGSMLGTIPTCLIARRIFDAWDIKRMSDAELKTMVVMDHAERKRNSRHMRELARRMEGRA